MKKKTLFHLFVIVATFAGAVCGAIYFIRKYADRLPFLSRFTSDEIEPEEDLFSDDISDSIAEAMDRSVPEASAFQETKDHEEKREKKIRRGYIPIRFHEKVEL